MNSRMLATCVGIVVGVAFPALGAAHDEPRFAIEFEAGPVWQSRNDVQIPNDEEGTRFSLEELAGTGPWPAGRIYFTWNITQRHGLRALAAPLSYTETGVFQEPVDFAGETYQPDLPTEATYKFNSWRLSYGYHLKRGSKWNWWIGFTAKVRDAKIELVQESVTSQEGAASKDTDVGFVPLFHLVGDWHFSERWYARLDLDALAGGPGRAEDVALKLVYDFSKRWSITGGYRTVEGGADTDEVYNFAWFHYAVVSGIYRF